MSIKIGNLKTKMDYCIIFLVVSGVLTASYAQYNQNIELYLLSVMLIFFVNILIGVQDVKSRLLFLIFQVSFFTFLVGRPLIGIILKIEGWMGSGQQKENIIFAFSLVFLSLLCMAFGVVLIEAFYRIKRSNVSLTKSLEKKNEFVKPLQLVSLIIFFVTLVFYLLVQIEPLIFMKGKTYVEYYTGFQSRIPGIFHTIASFMKYSLCIFLATMPSKKRAFFPLILFVLSAVPMLIIGVRNPIMLNSLFVVIYYCIREIKNSREKWIGRFEKIVIVIITPIALIFMAMYTAIRSQIALSESNPFRYLVRFFYEQGVTFNVLQIGYGYRQGIKDLKHHYTFGGMIDYIQRGTIGQKIWGMDPLPSGNCEINGILSNNLSHNLSYISMKEEYLNGRGRGSSFLLETYFDWGYIGVMLFSIGLAILLIVFLHRFGKKMLSSTVILVALTSIYFIPRAEATGWLTFIITIQFWSCVCVVYLATYCCMKIAWIRKIISKWI
ncbi:O-antigen polysaccharide polymerase Wzy family protein [Faecalicatena contorta]|uniref:O-antigen polysaccharide polymerase Wzy family protein n=1 Tax=Faecalicatena contorta TaxID=39482 RepID=UPI001F3B859C|nr:O-antigen polysaccharide polymerase Wzy family protein [Faecalicatena contorta]MCF2555207.1 O-antigen polysaccharide polymerase Wzy family protein [Faecalicatena contorta]